MGWRVWIGLAVALGGCCTASEGAYLEAARRHATGDPQQACCYSRASPPTAQCLAEAEARCGFVRGARVVSSEVARFGHDDGALVTMRLSGPKGAGECTVQVLNYPRGTLTIDGGGCRAR